MKRSTCATATIIQLTLVSALLAQTTPTPSVATIDAKRVTAHVKVLAADDFEGRAPGTAGEKKTVDYIIDHFAAAGVKPGGDRHPRVSRQSIEFNKLRSKIDFPSAITPSSLLSRDITHF